MPNKAKRWETYEQVAVYLLNKMAAEFGLDWVEGKQSVPGKQSGTDWEIDAKGVRRDTGTFLLIECRRYTTSRQNQGKLAALAYAIKDTGASGGILVSPLGLQGGAKKIASAENVVSVILDPNSTTTDYLLQFLQRVIKGVSGQITPSGTLTMVVRRADGSLEEHQA